MQGHQEWLERGIGMIGYVREARGFTCCLGQVQASCIQSLGTGCLSYDPRPWKSTSWRARRRDMQLAWAAYLLPVLLDHQFSAAVFPGSFQDPLLVKYHCLLTWLQKLLLGRKKEFEWLDVLCLARCVGWKGKSWMKEKVEVIVIWLFNIFCYSPHSNRSGIKSHLPKYNHTSSSFLHFELVLKYE